MHSIELKKDEVAVRCIILILSYIKVIGFFIVHDSNKFFTGYKIFLMYYDVTDSKYLKGILVLLYYINQIKTDTYYYFIIYGLHSKLCTQYL